MNKYKYNEIICNAVANCTKEMISLMKDKGLKMVDFVEHDVELPSTVFENESTGEYQYEDIESISLNGEEEIIVKGESGITGYLDKYYGDFFKVADSISHIYRALVESLERVDEGLSTFAKEEYEEKYSHGVTKDMWEAIIILLNLSEEEANNIVAMSVLGSNDKFDFIYIDFNERYYGMNYSVIRDRKNDDIYMPQGDSYPACINDIAMYTWVNVDRDSIMLNTENEMEKFDNTTHERLVYLNKNFPNIFDGISFVWHKNHTMCVKSKKDERNGDTKTSYVAIYDKHTDIVPIKLSKMEKLDVDFPTLF